MKHYETLGVKKDATAAEIKAAYRRLARKYHPDVCKEAGATDKIAAINVAYDILSDPERRARYDHGEDVSAAASPEELIRQRALQEVASLVIAAIDGCPNIDMVDMVADMRGAVRRSMTPELQAIENIKAKIRKHEKARNRIKYAGEGPSMLDAVIASNIEALGRGIAMHQGKIDLAKAVLDVLEDYEYRHDQMQSAGTQGMSFIRAYARQFDQTRF